MLQSIDMINETLWLRVCRDYISDFLPANFQGVHEWVIGPLIDCLAFILNIGSSFSATEREKMRREKITLFYIHPNGWYQSLGWLRVRRNRFGCPYVALELFFLRRRQTLSTNRWPKPRSGCTLHRAATCYGVGMSNFFLFLSFFFLPFCSH